MNEVAASTFYQRPCVRDLADMPMPLIEAVRARASLAADQLGVWFALKTHLWLYGELPVPNTPGRIKRLAGIGGVAVRTFRAMMPALAPLFDQDSFGRWGDREMEAERDRRLDLTPESRITIDELLPEEPEARGPDPAKARAGALGGQRSGERRREKRLRLVQGGRDDNLAPSPMTLQEADLLAHDGSGGGVAGATGGEAERSTIEARGEADGEAEWQAGSEQPASPSAPLATNQPTDFASLNQEADGGLVGRASASGSKQAEAAGEAVDGSRPASRTASLPDATIVDAVVAAANGKVSRGEAFRFLPVFRREVAPEVDLHVDFVPVLKRFARRMDRVDNWACRPILSDAAERAATRLAGGSSAGASLCWVDEGSPHWDAWLRFKGKSSHPTQTKTDDRSRRGWLFPSEWPPGTHTP